MFVEAKKSQDFLGKLEKWRSNIAGGVLPVWVQRPENYESSVFPVWKLADPRPGESKCFSVNPNEGNRKADAHIQRTNSPFLRGALMFY